MTAPEPITAPGIHDWEPTEPLTPPFTAAQLRGIGQAWRWRFLADVLYAVAGIEVFGTNPFEPLAKWADELVEMAEGALTAANYANAQLGSIATNVEGGLQINDQFNGGASSTLAGWFLNSTGPGAGTFGPNGSGRVVWTKSGGLARTHRYVYGTDTVGDYQAVQILLGELPEAPLLGDLPPYNYLCCRVSEFFDDYVFCRIGRSTIQVGYVVDGDETVVATALIPGGNQAGNVWRMQCGTVAIVEESPVESPYAARVTRNGVAIWSGAVTGSNYGEGYRGVGMIAEAAARFFFTDQSAPGEVDMFSAADLYVA